MSAAWIKELLLDYGLNRLSIDQKNDIASAIDGLIKSRVLSYIDAWILHAYVAGYTAEEIASLLYTIQWHITTEQVENELQRMMLAVGTASGYTDDLIIERAKQTQFRTKIPRFITFLQQHSTTYMEHDL